MATDCRADSTASRWRRPYCWLPWRRMPSSGTVSAARRPQRRSSASAAAVRIIRGWPNIFASEREQVRLHAYYTERILARPDPLRRLVGDLASRHHERLDGSGYHRSLGGQSLSTAARLLAAADTYQAMTEPRPHRPALSPAQAA